MKKFTFLAISFLCFLFAGIQSSKAQLLLEENFNFSGLLTDNGWVAHSGGGTLAIQTSSNALTYTDYSSGIGNHAALDTTGEDVNRNFVEQTAGSVYASFLVNIQKATEDGGYFLHLGATNMGTNFRGRVFVKAETGTNKLAFGISKSSNTAIYTNFDYDLNTTYLIVLKYTFISGGNQEAHLFVNPVINGVEPTANATDNATTGDVGNIATIALRQGAASTSPRLAIDGIRVGIAWADVLPFTPVANSGIFETLVITNDGANVYDISSSFDGKHFGNIPETGTFLFKGGQVKTWKHDPPDDVTGARMMYRIYLQGSTPLPAFDTIVLPWDYNYPTPGDQLWQNDTLDIDLVALTEGDYNFEVYFEAIYSTGGTPEVHIDNNNGNYYTASFTRTTTINTNNIFKDDKPVIYPNPASDHVNINLNSVQISTLIVYDILGRMVFTETDIHNAAFVLNTSALERGVYTMIIFSENQAHTSVLIVR